MITLFDPDTATINVARAAWCSQYALEIADEIVIGNLKPDGMLAFPLAVMPRDTPVAILSEEEPAAAGTKEPRKSVLTEDPDLA